MRWKYWIPHIWEPPEELHNWGDVYLLPEDKNYSGDALFLTIYALPLGTTPKAELDELPEKTLAQVRSQGYAVERENADIYVNTEAFTLPELLSWVPMFFKDQEIAFAEMTPGTIDEFRGRADMIALIDIWASEENGSGSS